MRNPPESPFRKGGFLMLLKLMCMGRALSFIYKRMEIKNILLFASCILSLFFCHISTSKGAFRDDFLGAKSVAMGGAHAALADDADCILINPAGLSMIKHQQIVATASALHVGLTDDSFISQNILGYAYQHRGVGSIGIVWKRFGVENLYSENIISLSLARDFGLFFKKGQGRKSLSLGAALTFMNWDSAPTVGPDGKVIEDLNGWRGFGFDLGTVIWPSENIPVAVAIQNLNKPNIASDSSKVPEKLPIKYRMGVAALGEKITWAMDMILHESQIDLRVGLERSSYNGNVLLRAGFNLENLAWGTNITLGAGYRPGEHSRIDYAFVYPFNTILSTLGSHRISIVYDF